MLTPRRVGVSIRWRNSCGLMSPTKWVAPLLFPFWWQSKQVTPRLGSSLRRSAVRFELLLRKGRHEQPKALELLWIQESVEELVVIVARDQLAPRDIAKIGPGREVNGRRELRQEPVRQVEIEVEAGQVATRLLLDLSDVEQGKDHSAIRMVRVRQRQEPGREETLVAELVGRHAYQRLPRRSPEELDTDAHLDCLPAAHRDVRRGAVTEIVT